MPYDVPRTPAELREASEAARVLRESIRHRGVAICISGIDGSGKTTLAHTLVGLLDEAGVPVRYLHVYQWYLNAAKVPFMIVANRLFGRRVLIFDRTVFDNIAVVAVRRYFPRALTTVAIYLAARLYPRFDHCIYLYTSLSETYKRRPDTNAHHYDELRTVYGAIAVHLAATCLRSDRGLLKKVLRILSGTHQPLQREPAQPAPQRRRELLPTQHVGAHGPLVPMELTAQRCRDSDTIAVTHLYFTIDTEYSPGFFQRHDRSARAENFASSIAGRTASGEAGIFYMMDVLDRHGLKAVFFVDPMPATIWGVEAIADVVGPIAARGHDVQMHLHTEWLEFAGAASPLPGRTARDIKDFDLDEQVTLLDYAQRTLIAAGAPPPVAFRAGNYGANDDTLRALARVGLRFDSSHCPGIARSACAISLGSSTLAPIEHCGIIEVPIGAVAGSRKSLRHFQLTALTDREIVAALEHASAYHHPSMTLVSHSFELLSRDRSKINRLVRWRFERVCRALASMPAVTTATYAATPPIPSTTDGPIRALPHSRLRTGERYAEQALSNLLYGQY